MRECGGCTLCCTLLAVPALDKPAGLECRHCDAAGCHIFGRPERPDACIAYQCAWLFNDAWPEKLRPDRCHVVFEPFGDRCFAAAVDPKFPNAWQEGIARIAIERLVSAGCPVIVVTDGENKHVLLPPGRTPEEVWSEVVRSLEDKHGSAYLRH